MIASLAETIALAAFAAIGLAVDRVRASAGFRAARLQAWLGLDDAERRAQGKPPRRSLLKRRRLKRLQATAIAYEMTREECECLQAEVAKRVAEVVRAAVAAASGRGDL